MSNLKYIGKNVLNHTLELKKGNVSGSATSTGSFGSLVVADKVQGALTVGGNLNVSQYIYHADDPNTYLNFTNDRLRFNIGGISYIDLNDAGSAPHDITFNDGSNNVDFIIKGDTNNPLFKTDSSANRIGTHGKGTPEVAFHIGGSELRVDGNISGSSTGTGSFGRVETSGDIAASGNISSSANITGNILNVKTRVKAIGSSLEFAGNTLDFVDGGSVSYLFRGISSGAFEAYHAGNKKLETAAGGINVTGNVTASGHISGSSVSTGSFGTIQTTTGTIPTLIGNTTVRDNLTVTGNLDVSDTIYHTGDSNTKIRFPEVDTIAFNTSGLERLRITSDGQISGSSVSTGSFGTLETGDVITVGANKKIYLNRSEDTYIQSMAGDIARVVAGGQQMLLLDYDTGNRAVFGNSTKVFIGANNTHQPDKELVVHGDVSGSGTGSFGLVEVSGMDIDPTGVARDQVLKFNGTNFVPAAYDATFEFSIADFDMNDSGTELIGSGSWKNAGALTFTAAYNNGPPDGYNGSAEGAPQIRGYVNNSISSSYDMYPLSSSFTTGTNPMAITYPLTSGHTIKFRLYASAGSDTDNDYTDQTMTFRNQFVYGDLSKNNGFNQADIRTLAAANTVTTNDTTRTLTVSVGGSNYLCFAHRTGDTNVAQVQCGSGTNILTVAMNKDDNTTITPLKETVSYLNTLGFTENFYVYASKLANVDAHSTTFTTLTSTQKKNYFIWGYDSQASSYDESFLETSGDWDSYNANSSYDDGTVTGQTLSVGSFTSKYVIIAFPDRYGDNETQFQFKDNSTSLPFDVTKQSDVTVTNAVGFQETYHVWRSTNLLTMTNLTVLIDSV